MALNSFFLAEFTLQTLLQRSQGLDPLMMLSAKGSQLKASALGVRSLVNRDKFTLLLGQEMLGIHAPVSPQSFNFIVLSHVFQSASAVEADQASAASRLLGPSGFKGSQRMSLDLGGLCGNKRAI